MKLIIQFLIIFLLTCSNIKLFAQETDTIVGTSISLGGGYVLSNHSASFTTLNPCLSCADFDNINFSNSTGNGFFIHSNFGWKLNKLIRIDIGADYYSTQADFTNRKFFSNVTNSNDELEQIYLNYLFRTYLDYLNIRLGPTFTIINNLNISFHIATNFLIKSKADYSEKIDENNKHFFADDSKVYALQRDVTLEKINFFQIGFEPSISYDFYIFKSIALTPKVSYKLGFSDIQQGTNWKMSTLNLSLNLTIPITYISTSNNDPLPECPPGMRRDKFMNCVPIDCPPGMIINQFGNCECPEGFERVGEECIKRETDIALNQKTECPPNFYFSEQTQKCEPIIPEKVENCKGAYLAFQVNLESDALRIIEYLNQNNIEGFRIEVSTDVVDKRQKVYQVRTYCYPSTSDAYIVKKSLSDLIQRIKENLNLQNISLEIIKD